MCHGTAPEDFELVKMNPCMVRTALKRLKDLFGCVPSVAPGPVPADVTSLLERGRLPIAPVSPVSPAAVKLAENLLGLMRSLKLVSTMKWKSHWVLPSKGRNPSPVVW